MRCTLLEPFSPTYSFGAAGSRHFLGSDCARCFLGFILDRRDVIPFGRPVPKGTTSSSIERVAFAGIAVFTSKTYGQGLSPSISSIYPNTFFFSLFSPEHFSTCVLFLFSRSSHFFREELFFWMWRLGLAFLHPFLYRASSAQLRSLSPPPIAARILE